MRLFELITEDYDNWDHEYPAKYSQHLEDTFGDKFRKFRESFKDKRASSTILYQNQREKRRM